MTTRAILICAMIASLWILVACADREQPQSLKSKSGSAMDQQAEALMMNAASNSVQENDVKALEHVSVKAYKLRWESIEPEQLNPIVVPRSWKPVKSTRYWPNETQNAVTVHFYTDENEDPPNWSILGVLEDHGTYSIGEVGVGGDVNQVTVETVDRTGDGMNEVVITGVRGATSVEEKVLGYDPLSEQWRLLLTTQATMTVDLDGDGVNEYVSESMGSLPSFVWIYRWTSNGFEKADVAESLGLEYASFDRDPDRYPAFRAGKDSNSAYYKYDHGQLLEMAKD